MHATTKDVWSMMLTSPHGGDMTSGWEWGVCEFSACYITLGVQPFKAAILQSFLS